MKPSRRDWGRWQRRCIATCLLLSAAGAAQAATTYYWPELPLASSPPCNSTLQACIDGTAAGDTVVILGAVQPDLVHRYGAVRIDEDITITHALTLSGDPAVDAIFSSGRSITVSTPSSGDVSTALNHLVLNGGSILVQDRSPTASTFTITDIRMHEIRAGAGCAIDVLGSGTVTQTVNIGGNVLEFSHPYASGFPGGICVLGGSGTLTTSIYNNHIRSDNAALFLGISQNNGNAGGTATISGNTVLGSGFDWGISTGPVPGAPAGAIYVHDNFVSGQNGAHVGDTGALLVHPQGSDVHLTNNTLVHSARGLQVVNDSGTAPTGRIANNLIAFNGVGINVPVAFASISNGNNLVYGNGSNFYTPGPGTLTLDPQINGYADARPRPGSPAIDAGNNADVPGFSADADAEPRIANGTVDIGAYEYRGQQTVVHTASTANTLFNYSDVALDNVDSGSLLLSTPHHRSGLTDLEATQNVGVYFSNDIGAPWAVYYENNSVPITPGRRFSVTSIGFAASRFLHLSTLANDSANFSQMSNPALLNISLLVMGQTHNYNPGGVGGTYYNERVGFNFQSSHWYLQNQNVADDFQSGRYFNVFVAPLLSLNAFKATVGTAPVARLALSHRLLDGNACAAPQVFRDSSAVVNDTALAVQYVGGGNGVPGHWNIVAEGTGATFPAGATFNVIVDGAQANACRDDVIFADTFEG
jgi:hypothetical protein